MFQSLPREYESQAIKPPGTESGKVNIGSSVIKVEWATDKGLAASFSYVPDIIGALSGSADRRLC